jgi:5-methylcytosine-specific restriction enzyme A
MAFKDVTYSGVLQAISEFDNLGEEAFYSKYGYGPAKSYFVFFDGKKYPSKAIFGVAHGFGEDGLEPLKFDDFSGGEQQVARPLRNLGFTVTGSKPRNPNWTRDELIIALRLYMDWEGNPPGKGSKEIIGLSETLNKLGRLLGIVAGEDYRNANGVYMKLMNFRRFDETYQSQGKTGLMSGGKIEAEIWSEFANDPARLANASDTIISFVDSDEEQPSTANDSEEDRLEASEGKLVTRTHHARERSAAIARKKKDQVLKSEGRLACEVCGFDFAATYGGRGENFIECHHTKPVSELRPGQKTKLGDLALVCANCHRMIHARRPWLSLGELKTTLAHSH